MQNENVRFFHGGRGTAFYAGVNFRREGSSLDEDQILSRSLL
jgi:hypothetical protein